MENLTVSGKINGMSGVGQPQQVGTSGAGQTSRNNMSDSTAATSAGAGSAAAGSAAAGADQVDITGAASELASAEQNLSAVPVVNEAKVSSIRSAVEAGTYRIQPQKIADKLVDYERGMPDAPDTPDSNDTV